MPANPFLDAYLNEQLQDFYAVRPRDTEAALKLERPHVQRPELSAALKRYAEMLAAPEAVFEAIEKLTQPNSRAVVTGQQAGVLLGPNYSLSKAITAIKLAQSLDSEARPVVPVFWVASQDHDTEEIDHAYLLDKEETLQRVELDLPDGTPAGRIPLKPEWVDRLEQDLAIIYADSPYLNEVKMLVRDSAQRAVSYADWFAALLYKLLGDEGLIIVNPLAPDIAELFRPILEAELKAPLESSLAINEAGKQLQALGHAPQLGRGEGATNLFLEEKVDGRVQRQLLRLDAQTFSSEMASYGADEVLEKLDADPRVLTPAAGFRPTTQDFLLPTAVTVVGPGELKYIAQLKGVYEQHGVELPLIWPRASVTLLEPPVSRILKKFDLSADEMQADFENIKNRSLLELQGHAESFDKTLATLDASLQSLLEHVTQIDPTLEGTVNRAEGYFKQTLAILETKSAKALAREDDIYTRQFGRLEAHLLPLGTPQERLVSPFSFFLKFGIQPVMRLLLSIDVSGDHILEI